MKNILFIFCIAAGCLELWLLVTGFNGDRIIQAEYIGNSAAMCSPSIHNIQVASHTATVGLKIHTSGVADTLFLSGSHGVPLSHAFRACLALCISIIVLKLGSRNQGSHQILLLIAAISLVIAFGFQYYGNIYTENWFTEHGLRNTLKPAASLSIDIVVYVVLVLFARITLNYNNR